MKLPCQKPRLREIVYRLQNQPITKNKVLPLTTLFFENLISVKESLKVHCQNFKVTRGWGHSPRQSFSEIKL